MFITFTRNRLRTIHHSIENGRCITSPEKNGFWSNSELLAVAASCMSELMSRRELKRRRSTDEPLQYHLQQPFGRLSGRLTAALNYALTIASAITNDCVVNGNKTYRMKIVYDGPEFMCMTPSNEEPDDESPVPNSTSPASEEEPCASVEASSQGESTPEGNALLRHAA